jgi:hypothetical protein
MNTIHVASQLHRGERRIKLDFAYNPEIVRIIRPIKDSKWSATMNCWHVPYNQESFAGTDWFRCRRG